MLALSQFLLLRSTLPLTLHPDILRPQDRAVKVHLGYYNNFEIIHIPTQRSETTWELFYDTDRTGSFFCHQGLTANQTTCSNMWAKTRRGLDYLLNGFGDAEYRAFSLPLNTNTSHIHEFSRREVVYVHPVSNWCAS